MAGTVRLPGNRGQKIAGGPEHNALAEANTPERFQPASPDNTGSPYIDVTTGKPYPVAPG